MRTRRLVAVALGIALALGLVPGVQPAGVHAYPTDNVNLEGHGWGHGRGMGQYGSLGYAINKGWDWQTILGHYYSNTAAGQIGNPGINVRLIRLDNVDTIVYDPSATARWNGNGARKAYLVRLTGANSFGVWAADDCAGGPSGWQPVATNVAGPVTISSLSNDGISATLQTCEAGGNRIYRNDILAADSGVGQRTVNGVLMENYLRGVVPRESPASWGTLGAGAGMNALRAQAVAARSYAWSESRYAYAKTCDTESCQVYGGVNGGGGEQATTNTAVAETAGVIRLLNGAPARTEFSSSTGGQTAGGTFPSVVDEGDTVSQNPNHNWSAAVPVSSIQSKYPSIGTLQAVSVTARTPEDGGLRVKTLVLRGSSANMTLTGDEFRIAFGLKSTWFDVVGSASGGVNGYWLLAADAGVFAFGKAAFHGSMGGKPLNKPVVGMAATPSGGGYWLVATDGGIFAFDAPFKGSMGGTPLNKPVVGMARTASGNGYWLVASDGGIFAFGDAVFHGSMGGTPLNKPVVGMAPTSTGNGYWLVASDGGIFAFGDAAQHFYGSTGSIQLARPVVGMTPLANDGGYWLVAADGGIFAFNAPFLGSLPSRHIVATAAAMQSTATGNGYEIVTSAGDVHSFGDAPAFGGVPDAVPGYTGTIIDIDVSYGS
jgi:SpoIID/LytB domain protein